MKEDAELSKQLKVMIYKSKDSLKVARDLHKQGYYNDSASKSYYAVFHALQAILLTTNMSFSKHSAVLSAFNKEFIYNDIFPRDFYKKIIRLFKDRQIGDYEYEKVIEAESSREDVDDAERIINAIIEYLKIE
jgi:uncharacterized protein (UPF0332 family)